MKLQHMYRLANVNVESNMSLTSRGEKDAQMSTAETQILLADSERKGTLILIASHVRELNQLFSR